MLEQGQREAFEMADAKEELALRTEMHWAVRSNDVGLLRTILKKDKQLVNAADYDKRTPLHIAASLDCVPVAKVLLAEGAELNAKDRWGKSPRGEAESAGYMEMVKLLKDYGAESHAGAPRGHVESLIQVAPPLPSNRDWEIAPSEIELDTSELIGKGSFGEIRKALWRGTPVAVKTIRPSLSNDRMVIKDFQHEVQLHVKVRHPNIVQFLGAVTRQRPLMLVTEFLAGGDLHQLLRSNPNLAPDRIVKYALDIARGMSYLHNRSKPIIHRDLKPRNIIVDEEHELKVGDFGLSKLIDVKLMHDVYKMTGETGSYRYMAPEVFEHQPYDKSVDVFSFGMILYEMFEGVAPFEDKDAYDAATLVARDDKRPEMRAQTYPPQMKALIEDCWSPYTPKRPPFVEIVKKLEVMYEDCLLRLPKDRRHLRDILHLRRNPADS